MTVEARYTIEELMDGADPLGPKAVAQPFLYTSDTGKLRVCFKCVSCGEALSWEKAVWACYSCGTILNKGDAAELLEEGIQALEHSLNVIRPRRRRTGWLSRIFSRLRRRRALSET